MEVICGLPFYVLWFIVSGYIIQRGWMAISQRYIEYRLYFPATKVRYQLTGRAVILIGVMQVGIGVLLLVSVILSLFDQFQVLQGVIVGMMCLALPAYYGVVRLVMRIVEVQFTEVFR
ncbi:MAG: hypothetical protein Kow00117_13900 [Phototrophicales bacterium]